MRVPTLPLWIDTFSNTHSVSRFCSTSANTSVSSSSLLAFHALSHYHTDHTKGLHPSWCDGIIFCSEVTRELVIEEFCSSSSLSFQDSTFLPSSVDEEAFQPWRVVALPLNTTVRVPLLTSANVLLGGGQASPTANNNNDGSKSSHLFLDKRWRTVDFENNEDREFLFSNDENSQNQLDESSLLNYFHRRRQQNKNYFGNTTKNAFSVEEIVAYQTIKSLSVSKKSDTEISDGTTSKTNLVATSYFDITLIPAAHIPGSVMIIVDFPEIKKSPSENNKKNVAVSRNRQNDNNTSLNSDLADDGESASVVFQQQLRAMNDSNKNLINQGTIEFPEDVFNDDNEQDAQSIVLQPPKKRNILFSSLEEESSKNGIFPVRRILYTGDFRIDGVKVNIFDNNNYDKSENFSSQTALQHLTDFIQDSATPVDILYTDTTWLHLNNKDAEQQQQQQQYQGAPLRKRNNLLNCEEASKVLTTIYNHIAHYRKNQIQMIQLQQERKQQNDEEERTKIYSQHNDDDDLDFAANDGCPELEQKDPSPDPVRRPPCVQSFPASSSSSPPFILNVYLQSHFGKEVLLQPLARALKTRILVDRRRFRLLCCIARTQQQRQTPQQNNSLRCNSWDNQVDINLFCSDPEYWEATAANKYCEAQSAVSFPCIRIVSRKEEVDPRLLSFKTEQSGGDVQHYGLYLSGWSSFASSNRQINHGNSNYNNNNQQLAKLQEDACCDGENATKGKSSAIHENATAPATVWAVPFSLHCSGDDLVTFVGAIRPRAVFPLNSDPTQQQGSSFDKSSKQYFMTNQSSFLSQHLSSGNGNHHQNSLGQQQSTTMMTPTMIIRNRTQFYMCRLFYPLLRHRGKNLNVGFNESKQLILYDSSSTNNSKNDLKNNCGNIEEHQKHGVIMNKRDLLLNMLLNPNHEEAMRITTAGHQKVEGIQNAENSNKNNNSGSDKEVHDNFLDALSREVFGNDKYFENAAEGNGIMNHNNNNNNNHTNNEDDAIDDDALPAKKKDQHQKRQNQNITSDRDHELFESDPIVSRILEARKYGMNLRKVVTTLLDNDGNADDEKNENQQSNAKKQTTTTKPGIWIGGSFMRFEEVSSSDDDDDDDDDDDEIDNPSMQSSTQVTSNNNIILDKIAGARRQRENDTCDYSATLPAQYFSLGSTKEDFFRQNTDNHDRNYTKSTLTASLDALLELEAI